MTCALCGHRAAAATRRCPRCGAPLGTDVPAPYTPAPDSAPLEQAPDRTVARSALHAPATQPGPDAAASPQPTPQPTPQPAAAPPAAPLGAQPTLGAAQPAAPEAGPIMAPTLGAPEVSVGARLGGAILDSLALAAVQLAALLAATRLGDALAVTLTSALVGVAGFASLSVLTGRGQTLGKALVNTHVVDYRTGRPLGPVRGALRTLTLGALMLPLGLGLLTVLRPGRRGWHDLVAGSVVVPNRPRPAQAEAAASSSRLTTPITR